jgi:hypothetical protein
MVMGHRRLIVAIAAAAGLVASFTAPALLPQASATPGCGTFDKPETGIEGDVPLTDQLSGRADQGYNCGIAVVGYNSLGGRGGNANMAWSGDCAYIAGAGIAVVDAHDPTHPKQVGTLQGPGSNVSVETINAVDAKDRHLLVAGRYGLFPLNPMATAPVDVWDTTDCAHPRLLSTIDFPSNVHNLTLTADGRRLYTTLPLQAADLTDPRHPRYLGNIENDLRAEGIMSNEYAHEAWPSPDGRRLYIGGQLGFVGDEQLRILDISGWPQRRATVLGSTPLPGHSIRPATINGKPYLLNSDESIINPTAKGCFSDALGLAGQPPDSLTPVGGASQPFLTDISDEHHPHAISQFRLPINARANCPAQLASGVNASVHYNDVDDPNHTTFALLSMWNAGLRIVDVRDPYHPTEAAYFNPGRFAVPKPFGGVGVDPALELQSLAGLDQAWAHVRYRPETGQIWLTTRSGGFWVLELEPQVRASLGLPAKPTHNPRGGSPRPAASHLAVNPLAGVGAAYCVLNTSLSSALGRVGAT